MNPTGARSVREKGWPSCEGQRLNRPTTRQLELGAGCSGCWPYDYPTADFDTPGTKDQSVAGLTSVARWRQLDSVRQLKLLIRRDGYLQRQKWNPIHGC
jgi:hypothetical protein